MPDWLRLGTCVLLLSSSSVVEAAQVIIDGTGPNYVNNGSFETTTLVDGRSAPVDWIPLEFTNPSISGPGVTTYRLQSDGNRGSSDGDRAQTFGVNNVTDIGQAPGIDTGYTIQTGDIFTLSFFHIGTFGWDEGDQLDWSLFYTTDDTIIGTPTALFSGSVSPPDGGDFGSFLEYQASGDLISPPAAASAAGRRLFLSFLPGAGVGSVDGPNVDPLDRREFGRIDQVNLTVHQIPEPRSLLLLLVAALPAHSRPLRR